MSDDTATSSRREKFLCVIEKEKNPPQGRPEGTVIAEIGDEIYFEPEILDTFDVEGCQPLHYDLLLLAAAVEFADRRWKRPRGWSRTLNLTLPVFELGTWQKSEVIEHLQRALRHLTGDAWRFDFVQAIDVSPLGLRQGVLHFPKKKTFAIAYSEGLDSRAVSALSGKKDEALCIRVANQPQRRRNGDSPFDQIPFRVKGHGSSESSFRSRGFQFAAVTAIAAQLSNIPRIVVPESGQGALGPVLRPLHNVYADYRNHPTFFRKMERFTRALLGHDVRYEQPRLWHTKAQTMSAFLAIRGKSKEELINTRSCWQTRRVVNVDGVRKHCGLCAACLLRRLSIHAAELEETAATYVVSDLSTGDLSEAFAAIPLKEDRLIMMEYGSIGARHLQHLADMATWPDDQLTQHVSEIAAATDATPEETLANLRTLLVNHAREWHEFVAVQGPHTFLQSWIEGGRHGRSE